MIGSDSDGESKEDSDEVIKEADWYGLKVEKLGPVDPLDAMEVPDVPDIVIIVITIHFTYLHAYTLS